MNIVMITNTYLPHVGGVAHSVASFSEAYRRAGHRVLVVAPTFPNLPERESDIIRVPAIQNFNGSDFSVRIPVPGFLSEKLDRFQPDVIHSHHPFLLGDAALRYASSRSLPLVFTHHTMYEQYTHYVPADLAAMKPFVMSLATEYANLCDQVIAPSESVAGILLNRGVYAPITVIPTGIERGRFATGHGARIRKRFGIEKESLVIGHLGRLAPEKNLSFLAAAVAAFMDRHLTSRMLVVGAGPAERDIRAIFAGHRLTERLHFAGTLHGEDLVDAYHAMDVFAFASRSETQGMVLAEAMAAGLPVVALDAPGVREVVKDQENGRLLASERVEDFCNALSWLAECSSERWSRLREAALRTAAVFDRETCAAKALNLYNQVEAGRRTVEYEHSGWTHVRRRLGVEWNLWSSRAEAAVRAWKNTNQGKTASRTGQRLTD